MTNTELVEIAKARKFIDAGLGRSIRLGAGLSCADIGKAIGAEQSTVWRWEAEERHPRGEMAIRYATLLRELMDAR